jgi:hypothetical protein
MKHVVETTVTPSQWREGNVVPEIFVLDHQFVRGQRVRVTIESIPDIGTRSVRLNRIGKTEFLDPKTQQVIAVQG